MFIADPHPTRWRETLLRETPNLGLPSAYCDLTKIAASKQSRVILPRIHPLLFYHCRAILLPYNHSRSVLWKLEGVYLAPIFFVFFGFFSKDRVELHESSIHHSPLSHTFLITEIWQNSSLLPVQTIILLHIILA